MDRYLARNAVEGQCADTPVDPARQDNLFETMPNGHATRGEFGHEARRNAVQLSAGMTRGVGLAGLLAVGAVIGDCESAALVSREGSIDWLCWPRFDSDACFARLLGDEKHGRWSLAPVCEARVSRRYLPGTLVLETRFETEQGSVALTDFMPIRGGEASNSTLVRILRGESGSVDMTMDLAPRFQYGTIVPWLTRRADDTLRLVAGPHAVHLRSSHSI